MSTLSPRGSNAANRLTPEQKLARVQKYFNLYVASDNSYRYYTNRLIYARYGTEDLRLSILRRLRAANRCVRIMVAIQRLTAPAGGAE